MSSETKKAILVLILIYIGLFLVTSCTKQNTGIEETHNAEGQDFIINVKTFPTDRALDNYLKTNGLYEGFRVDGLARWTLIAVENKVKRCNIYVVKPKSAVDYNNMETWGHELVHCVYGSFHKDGVR